MAIYGSSDAAAELAKLVGNKVSIVSQNFVDTGCQFDKDDIAETVARLSKNTPDYKSETTVRNMCRMFWAARNDDIFAVTPVGHIGCSAQGIEASIRKIAKSTGPKKTDIKAENMSASEFETAAKLFMRASNLADVRERRADKLADRSDQLTTPHVDKVGRLMITNPTKEECFGSAFLRIPLTVNRLLIWVKDNVVYGHTPAGIELTNRLLPLLNKAHDMHLDNRIHKLCTWEHASELFAVADAVVALLPKSDARRGSGCHFPSKCFLSHLGRQPREMALAEVMKLTTPVSSHHETVEEADIETSDVPSDDKPIDFGLNTEDDWDAE